MVQEFEFEVLTVDRRGEVQGRSTCTAAQFTQDLGGGVALEMVAIPAGTFRMGSRPGRGYDDECPQHSVIVSGFLMGKYPVTQEQWEAVMDWRPPYRCSGTRRPVDRVSWNDATRFCERLSETTGWAYRLPSEAEWEYACRAGTTTPFHFGETITTDLANYVGVHTYRSEPEGAYRHETTEVGSFPANGFGLYDVHGNVWEWCADGWHDDYVGAPVTGSVWESRAGSYRVLRGGCWHDPPGLCRSAARLRHVEHEGEDYFGFRVALGSLE
jgi:formylglycine-generating enzyme required for sulfatase activity